MTKLTVFDIRNYKKLLDQVRNMDNKINERVGDIIVLILNFFKKRNNLDIDPPNVNWWYLNAEEGEIGQIELDNKFEGNIEYELELEICPDMFDSGKSCYSYSFPQKFLVMKDGEIIEHIELEIKESELEIKESEDRKQIDDILKKLTKQEIQVLGIKR